MNSQPISLIRGHDNVVPVRIDLGYAPLDLSIATAATFTAKPGELSTIVKITKTLGSGVTAGLLGLANISFSVADMAELDVSNSYTWSLTATVGGVASIVARGVLTAIGKPQQFVDEGVDQVARDLAASKASPEQVAASTASHNDDPAAHGLNKSAVCMPWFSVDSTYTGGGASRGLTPAHLGATTGAAGGSAVRRARSDLHPIVFRGQNSVYSFNVPFRIRIPMVRSNAAPGGVFWFSVGLLYDDADTAQNSVGVVAKNGSLSLRYRNGGGLVDGTVASAAVGLDSCVIVDIWRFPTSLRFAVNDVVIDTVETGALSLHFLRSAGIKITAESEEAWRIGIPCYYEL